MSASDADLERRFGGLRRLYGDAAYARIRAARVVVVGVGGVGSWAAEALARSGVAALTLIDLDHVAESNINRQVQALGATLGMAKVQALAQRIADIHPACVVRGIEEFVDAHNWPALLRDDEVDAVIDACDQVRAKQSLAAWALRTGTPFVCVGAAGGKQRRAARRSRRPRAGHARPAARRAAPTPAQERRGTRDRARSACAACSRASRCTCRKRQTKPRAPPTSRPTSTATAMVRA